MNELNYKIDIHGKFGSKFQKSLAINSLKVVLQAWVGFYISKHKKTEITVIQKEI